MNDKQIPNNSQQNRASELFMKNYFYVQHIAMITAPASHLRDDIVHDAFVNFVSAADKLDLEQDILPLLRVITINSARAGWRKYLQTLPKSEEKIAEHIRSEVQLMTPEDDSSTLDDEVLALNFCLNSLSERSRAIIQRHYFDEQTFSALAKETGMTLTALYKMVTRIRTFLRQCVERTIQGGRKS